MEKWTKRRKETEHVWTHNSYIKKRDMNAETVQNESNTYHLEMSVLVNIYDVLFGG